MATVNDEQTKPDRFQPAAGDDRAEYSALTDTVRELIRLMRDGNVERLEIKHGDLEISIASRETPAGIAAGISVLSALPAASIETAPPSDESNIHIIKSPMIGTYYSAPAPTEPPFVAEGDRIDAGQTVAIIEAMKTMNEIQSEVAGVVEAILVKNGDPVEYGHPLMRVRVGSDLG